MKKDYINVGIIGVGNIGSAHAASIFGGKIEGLRLAALCDTSKTRRGILQGLYPEIPIFENADALLASGLADAVIIATPHYFHPEIAEKAFASGHHVLTEKPAGVTCEAVRKMMTAAELSGKQFAIMFNQRTNKLFRAAKEIVSSGALGKLKRAVWLITNWYRKQCYYDSGGWRATWSGEGGGVLLNQAPHNLDILQWLCGMPSSIYAKCDEGKFHRIEVEDDATIMMRYQNGMTAVFITSTGEYPGTNRLEIAGTKGKIVIENGKLTYTALSIDERDFCLMEETAENPLSVTELTDEKYNGHIEILKNFARAILFGEPLVSPGYDGIFELTISNAAYLSSWTGEEITLPMDEEAFTSALAVKRRMSADKGKAKREDVQFSYKDRWNTNW